LGDAGLPDGVSPSVSPLSSPSGLIYRYVLQSTDRSPMELKTFEDWVIAPQYRAVPGVADDSAFGGGFYSQGGQFYYVRGLGRLRTLEDIGNVVVAVHDGTPVLLKDVGKVTI